MNGKVHYSRLIGLLISAVFLAGATPAEPPKDEDVLRRLERDRECEVCHIGLGDPDAPKLKPGAYRTSVHGDVGCVGCHSDLESSPIQHEKADQDLAPVDCGRCHEDESGAHAKSLHYPPNLSLPGGEPRPAATCADCHGSHNVLPSSDPSSTMNPARQVVSCGHCHDQQKVPMAHPFGALVLDLQGPGEGNAHPLLGPPDPSLVVAVACTDCHESHEIRAVADGSTRLGRDSVSHTCGRCHQKAEQALESGAHALGNSKPGSSDELPVCTSCHRVHDAKATSESSEVVCGHCHEPQQKTYEQSYHGRATALGNAEVARCWDCHSSHGVLKTTDPGSMAHRGPKVEVCRNCHQDAADGLASFWPHADPTRPEAYPVLASVRASAAALLIAILCFVGLHTFSRFQRTRGLSDAPIAPLPRTHGLKKAMRIVGGVALAGLVITGGLVSLSHQPELTGSWVTNSVVPSLHAVFGGLLIVALLVHAAIVILRLQQRSHAGRLAELVLGPDSPLPQIGDLLDLIRHVRWLVGAGPRPGLGRLGYLAKLDFWAVLLTVLVMAATGLVLRFPGPATWLLPGVLLNVATVLHSREALFGLTALLGLHLLQSQLRRNAVAAAEDQLGMSEPLSPVDAKAAKS